jgi:hypothetical protein
VHVCHAPSFPASAVADVNVHCIHTDTVASLTVAFIRDDVVLPGRGLPVLQQLELDDQLIHSTSALQQQQQQSQADDTDSVSESGAAGSEQSQERSQEQSNWPLQQRASLAHMAALSDSSAYDTLKSTAAATASAAADASSAATTALNTASRSLHSNTGSVSAHWGVAASDNSGGSSGFRRASEPLQHLPSLVIPSHSVVNADATTADAVTSVSGSISGSDWRRQQQQQQWQLEHDEAAGGVINDSFASRFNQGE